MNIKTPMIVAVFIAVCLLSATIFFFSEGGPFAPQSASQQVVEPQKPARAKPTYTPAPTYTSVPTPTLPSRPTGTPTPAT